jgi:hypothetical protein
VKEGGARWHYLRAVRGLAPVLQQQLLAPTLAGHAPHVGVAAGGWPRCMPLSHTPPLPLLLPCRLATLYLETKEYQAALALISKLLTEVKRLEDKLLLVDIHLLESKVIGWPGEPLERQSRWLHSVSHSAAGGGHTPAVVLR